MNQATRETAALHNVIYFSDLAILGGGEVCLVGLLGKLDRNRFRPLVVAPEKGPLTKAVEEMGIEARTVKLFEGMRAWRIKRHLYLHLRWRLRRSLSELRTLIERTGVALIHTHGGMYPENIRHLGRLAREFGIPMVWTCGYGGTYPRRVTDEFILPWVDRVIAVSESVRDRLLSPGGIDPRIVTVLHHGLDPSSWRESFPPDGFRRRHGVEEEEILFGTVGRVVRVKGHDLFIRAAALLAREEPLARFMVVGDQRPVEGTRGSYYRSLKEEARRLGLGERLIFTGWCDDVPQAMSALDVLVQPSRQEAFGRTLLEAMALEKPVIATRVGGMPEIVVEGETGVLVPPEDPQALAEAMRKMIHERESAREMGRRGGARLRRRFSLADRTRKVEGIYEEVISASHGSRDRVCGGCLTAAQG